MEITENFTYLNFDKKYPRFTFHYKDNPLVFLIPTELIDSDKQIVASIGSGYMLPFETFINLKENTKYYEIIQEFLRNYNQVDIFITGSKNYRYIF
jgi:hypothetical protein